MNDSEIRKALDDIAELKKSVRAPLKIMRPILLDKAFVAFSYAGAVFFSLCFVGLHFLILEYGTFNAIPLSLKFLSAGIFSFLLIPFSIIKARIIKQNLARHKRSISVWSLLSIAEFRGFFMVLLYGFCLFIFLFIYICLQTGNWWLLLPASALCFAFSMALFSLNFQVREYFTISLVSAAFGIVSLIFMKENQLLWLASFLGLVSAAFGVMIQLSKGSDE